MFGSVKSKSAIYGCLLAFALLTTLVAFTIIVFALRINEIGISTIVIISYLVELFYIARAVASCKNLEGGEANCDSV